MRAHHRFTATVAALALGLTGGCDKGAPSPRPDPAASIGPAGESPTEAPSSAVGREHRDLVDLLAKCEAHAMGLLLDFGADASEWRRGYSLGPFDDAPGSERKGATFARIMSRRTSYDFWIDEPTNELEVSARVHGARSPDLSVFIDGRRVGTVKLAKDETRVVTLGTIKGDFPAGRHTLVLAFRGAVGTGEAFAEVDWVRIGDVGADMSSYAAPTLRDVVANVVLDDKPRRAIALRAGSSIRCPVRIGPEAELSVSLGFWGTGKGRAVLSLLRDGEPPVELDERRVTGGGGATWTPLKVDLRPYAAHVVGLELSVPEATAGGRVAFGDPTIQRARAGSTMVPEARTAVLVILGGTDRKWIPPWGDANGLPAVADFARVATAFSAYRVPTTVVSATIASVLSGLGPRAHTLEQPSNRLPDRVLLLSEILKEAGGRSAMFTGVPTSSAAFGFDSGWETFDWVSPVTDAPATEPITRAAAWLQKELAQQTPGRRLLVIHLRGAHPPWDLTKDEVRGLRPAEYTGPFEDARKGGSTLVRYRATGRASRLDDDDWARLRALEQATLVRQAEAIGTLLHTLRDRQELANTLFVLMGDVGPGDGPAPPFDPAGELTADRLLVPLIVKFPGSGFAGREITDAVTSVDVARTIADALRLRLPESTGGEDLFEIASDESPVVARALVATLGDRYSTRFGQWTLSGQVGRVPHLCRLDVDPACENDVFNASPVAAVASWQATFDELASEAHTGTEFSGPRGAPEAANLNPDTTNSLIVWGDIR